MHSHTMFHVVTTEFVCLYVRFHAVPCNANNVLFLAWCSDIIMLYRVKIALEVAKEFWVLDTSGVRDLLICNTSKF
jgi:hypothetical protein